MRDSRNVGPAIAGCWNSRRPSSRLSRRLTFVARLSVALWFLWAAIPACEAEVRQSETSAPVEVSIDTGTVINTMRGGIGASWHAIEKPIPIGNGGSGWGAYPPADDERAWQQIYRHASWLGLDWNRVEVEQRIYEPERGKFTFDSPEMRILYRILDWNQRHGSDVFFQQMWANTAWLTYGGYGGDPVRRVHSAPRDLYAFADGLATLMDYLIKERGYTCIHWLSITNEPGAKWSWWQGAYGEPLPIGPGLTAVRKALARHGLSLPLSGPDAAVEMFGTALTPNDALLLGAYDFHDYGIRLDSGSGGYLEARVKDLSKWAKFAHAQNKPLFVSEFGTGDFPESPSDERPNNPENVLAAIEFVIRGANVGVDGFNRWSFLNRGDLDGQWQYVDTWDVKHKELLKDFAPHANSYFGLGLLSRFTSKHSAVLATDVRVPGENGRQGVMKQWQHVYCAAFRSPSGNVTLAVVNDASEGHVLKLSWAGVPPAARFFRYRYGKPQYNRADLKVNPEDGFAPAPRSGWTDLLPPKSLTIYSTYELRQGDAGIIFDGPRNTKH